jgi:hypothetical protein
MSSSSQDVDDSVQDGYNSCDFNQPENQTISKWYSGELSGISANDYNTVDAFVDDTISVLQTYSLDCTTSATQVNSEIYDGCTVNGTDISQVNVVNVDTNCINAMNTDASSAAVIDQVIQSYNDNIDAYDPDEAINQLYNLSYNITTSYTTDCSTSVLQANQIVCTDSSGTLNDIEQCSYYDGQTNCIQTNQDFTTIYRNLFYATYGYYPNPKPTTASSSSDTSSGDDDWKDVLTTSLVVASLIIIIIAIFLSVKNKKILKSASFNTFWIGLLLFAWLIPGFFVIYWPYVAKEIDDEGMTIRTQDDANQTNYMFLIAFLVLTMTMMAFGIGGMFDPKYKK